MKNSIVGLRDAETSRPYQSTIGVVDMTESSLTQERLKELLNYNPDTGIFTRAIARQGARCGDVAGTGFLGYVRIRINDKRYYGHRLAWLYMYGEWPRGQIDHVNHNRADNKIINLREVNHQENQKNQTKYKNNTSGINGVCWLNTSNRWRARIKVSGKSIYLGIFSDKFEAICARMSANNKYGYHENHGECNGLFK